MLDAKIEEALNQQIAHEAHASNFYLAVASWCEQKGFDGTASFFYKQSEEEREHMMKIFRYVNENEGHALAPAVEQPPHDFPSYRSLFEKALEHEKAVTQSIHELMHMANDARDYRTQLLLQWFVDEQLEEERQFQTILDKLNLIGDDGVGLYMLDTELGKRAEPGEVAEEG